MKTVVRCDFCLRGADDLLGLIQGAAGAICYECVAAAMAIVAMDISDDEGKSDEADENT